MRGGDGAGERVGSKPPPLFLPERWDFLPGGGVPEIKRRGSRRVDFYEFGRVFMISGRKSAHFGAFSLFFAPKRFFAHFSLQNAKIGHGPGTLL